MSNKYRNVKYLISRLPEGYTELAYVESTTIGIKLLNGTEANWSGASYFTLTMPGMVTMSYGPGCCTHGIVGSSNNRIVQLGSNNDISYWCEKVKPEGVTNLSTWKEWLAIQNITGTPLIICYPLATAATTANKFYYMKGALPDPHTYVPAKNSSDVAGLYCLETSEFITTINTGTFTAGPVTTGGLIKQALTMYKIGGGRLPEGYTELEYIEGDGSAYLDIGFKANQDTSSEVVFAPKETPTNVGIALLFGSSGAWSNASFGCYKYSTWYSNYNSDTTLSGVTIPTGTKAKIYKDKNLVYIDDSLVYTHAEVTFQSTTNLLLGKISISNQYGSYAKFYSCKIWDNGTLIREMIPCKNSSNVLGMYDLINNQFYTNAGTGEFTAGPEVHTYTIKYAVTMTKEVS